MVSYAGPGQVTPGAARHFPPAPGGAQEVPGMMGWPGVGGAPNFWRDGSSRPQANVHPSEWKCHCLRSQGVPVGQAPHPDRCCCHHTGRHPSMGRLVLAPLAVPRPPIDSHSAGSSQPLSCSVPVWQVQSQCTQHIKGSDKSCSPRLATRLVYAAVPQMSFPIHMACSEQPLFCHVLSGGSLSAYDPSHTYRGHTGTGGPCAPRPHT